VANFLDAKVREIEERLQQLQPLVDEFRKLEAASAVLNDLDGGRSAPRPAARAPRAASAPAPSRETNGGRRGRPRGSRGDNTRATQTIELVRAHPGITIPELAEHMGIKPNYLYRILPQLSEDGKVQRKDKGWFPA
jgi:hypothetical protein